MDNTAQQTISFLLISCNIYKCIAYIKKDKYQQSPQISNTEQGRLRIESSGGYIFWVFVCFIYLTPKEEGNLVRK